MTEIVNLKTNSFDSFLKESEIPVLVDFWAPWCAPCKMMNPIFQDLSDEYEGTMTVAKVNIDDEPELMDGIRSVPTTRLYINGKVVKEIFGAKPKAAMLKELSDHLGQ